MIYLLIILTAIFLMLGCHADEKKPLEITTNLWVGFTPIIYAKESGMLKDTNIRLNIVSSLGESVRMYDSGLIDGFTSTQEDALKVKEKRQLIPVFLIDKSDGADIVVSSLTEAELKSQKNLKLSIFYEQGTVNDIMLEYFMNKDYMRLNGHKIKKYNLNQDEIWSYKMDGLNSIIVTYDPYATAFKKRGYKPILSSDQKGILIYDALFINHDAALKSKDDIIKLNKAMKASIDVLKQNPEMFYDKIKNYLQGQSYDEFIASLKGVKWLNDDSDVHAVLADMRRLGIDTKELIF